MLQLKREYTPEDDSFSHGVSRALGRNYAPEGLIAALKQNPRLAHLYEQDSGVMESYSIERHSLFVLHQFERYFCDHPIPVLSLEAMRIMLALHDIGKPLRNATESQHQCTLRILDELQADLPISSYEFRIIRALVSQDFVGTLIRMAIVKSATVADRQEIHRLDAQGGLDEIRLKEFTELTKVGKTEADQDIRNRLIETGKWFIQNGEELNILPGELLRLALIYYQSDTMAYTSDAVLPSGEHAKVGLEFLYRFNWQAGARRPSRLFMTEVVKSPAGVEVVFSNGVRACVDALKHVVSFLEASIPCGAIISKSTNYPEKVRAFRARLQTLDLPSRVALLEQEREVETQALYLKSIILSRWDPDCKTDDVTKLDCMRKLFDMTSSPLFFDYIKVLAYRAVIAISPEGAEVEYLKKANLLRNQVDMGYWPQELSIRIFENQRAIADWIKVFAPNRLCYAPQRLTDEGYPYGGYVYLQGLVLRDLGEFLGNIDSAKCEADLWGCQLPFNERNFPKIRDSFLGEILPLIRFDKYSEG